MNRHLTADELAALALGLDGEAEDAGRRAHLEACPACREALAADAALLRSLGDCPPPDPSLARWDRMVREALEDTPSLPAAARLALPPRAFAGRLREWGLRAAVLCMVFLAGMHVGSQRRGASEPQLAPGVRIIHEPPVTPAFHHAAPRDDSAATTASIPSHYLMVRSEDRPC